MILLRKIPVIIILSIILIAFACHEQNQGTYPIKMRRVNDKVIVCNCFGANVAAVSTSKGLVIIDTNRSPGIMEEIKRIIIKEFKRNDILHVINTHGHWDHASGNQLFQESTIIGHENCPEFMKRNPATALAAQWSLEHRLSVHRNKLQSMDQKSDEARALAADIHDLETFIRDLKDNYSVTPPGLTFRDSMTLDAGDMTFKLFYCGNAHTNNDIFIYIPEQKMLFSGDMFAGRGNFSFGVDVINDIPRVLAAIDRILLDGSGVEHVITGHGQSDLSGSDLENLKRSLQEQYLELDRTRSAALFFKKMLLNFDSRTAVQKYQEFRKKNKDKGKFYFSENEFSSLGRQMLWNGWAEKAISAFRVMTDEFPASALAPDNLAEAFLQNNDIDSAVKYYDRSLQLYPGNINAQEILKLLRK